MERIWEWMEHLSVLATAWGVPAEYSRMAALGLIYLVATLIVALLLLLLFRIRRACRPDAEPPAVDAEAPEEPDEPGPSVDVGVPEVESSEAAEEAAVEKPEEPSVLQVETAEEKVPPPVEVEAAVPASLWDRMRSGLAKTRSVLTGPLDQLLSGKARISEELLEELEEALVTADFGIKTTRELIQALEERLGGQDVADPRAVRDCLQDNIVRLLNVDAPPMSPDAEKPFVIMIVGVNGAGKTTSIGKLASRFRREGKTVLLGAGDTFRAAAADQLAIWGERTGTEVIRQQEGSDPAAVAFDTAKAAVRRNADVVLLDTAGRLHTKTNLMEEIKKIQRVLGREIPGAPHETLLVLDATTGQNALAQARLFNEALNLTGVILTKLDGTAKGGVVVPIASELGLPVRFVGVGEAIGDLRPFDSEMFARALFSNES